MRRSGVTSAVGLTAAAGLAALALAACQKTEEAKSQGWGAKDRTAWYTYSQGSRLLPLKWAEALEMAGSTQKFLDPAHMIQKLGYLPAPDGNAMGLPMGFVVDATPDARLSNTAIHWKAGQGDGSDPNDPKKRAEPWVGLNCSACHTAQMTYQGKTLKVDGGPALSDFQQFLVDLRDSLNATVASSQATSPADRAKFDRFADAVLVKGSPDDTPDNRKLLAGALKSLADHENGLAAVNATDVKYGYGRLDAFGHIFSKVAYAAAREDAVPQPSDAPTSYPFLWGITYQDRIQYNGVAKNAQVHGVGTFDPGALARNIGEVIGVFADVSLTDTPTKGYRSSVNVANLGYFETELEALRAPAWPGEAMFGDKGKLDAKLVARGRELFGADNTDPKKITCASCHHLVAPDSQTQKVSVKMSMFNGDDPPGTDPWMACNAVMRTGPAGVLKGSKKLIFLGEPIGAEPPILDMLTNTAAGVLLEQKGQVLATAAGELLGGAAPVKPPKALLNGALTPTQRRLQACLNTKSDFLGYKARPLNGIWATAPYLHNGSVATLAELLDPANRRAVFWVGGREYDPVNLGYVSTEGVGSKFDTSLFGNSNAGHDYGTSALSPPDRRALLEYLKTL